MEQLRRLQELFRDLFQLDLADLDFGLYRLLHLKREEVETFLNEQLASQVEEAFEEMAGAEREALQMRLEQLADQIRESTDTDAILPSGEINEEYQSIADKVRPLRDAIDQYEHTRDAMQGLQISEARKAEVYNHLYSFFSRYYEDGDFIPRHRYGAFETYAVPFGGEEVHFHWANKNQHYVKTAETLKDYAFMVSTVSGEFRVRFKLTDGSVPKDDVKGERRFFFPRPNDTSFDAGARELIVPFEYRPSTDEEIEQFGKTPTAKEPGQEEILEWAVPLILNRVQNDLLVAALGTDQRAEKDKARDKPELPLLLKRFRHFARRQTSDFFVHKNLRGFLSRELEFYVKDRVLHLEDLEGDLEGKRRVIRVFRLLAKQVIDFLAQIEDAQRILFDKKKFVLETSYLIPVQHVPRRYWPDIVGNQAQLEEWKDWLLIDPRKDLFNQNGSINEAFLEQRPSLTISTRHFDNDWVSHLVENLPFEDLDEATDGLLIHGENYQALRMIEERFRRRVKCIYIDPPYNTGNDDFLYKDRYQHSTWLAMMDGRLNPAADTLAPDGAIFTSVDYHEQPRLSLLMEHVFGERSRLATVSVAKGTSTGQDAKKFGSSVDYLICFRASDKFTPQGISLTPEDEARFSREDERGMYALLQFRKTGSNDRKEDRPDLHYGLTAPDGTTVFPVGPTGYESCWRAEPDTYDEWTSDGLIEWIEKEHQWVPYVKYYLEGRTKRPSDLWDDLEGQDQLLDDIEGNKKATIELKNLFGRNPFKNPKPTDLVRRIVQIAASQHGAIVLDFFAGSGTSGHAIIKLNREDGFRRKFILIEMGECFDTVLVPRIAKVMYSSEWKDGKPGRLPMQDELLKAPRLVKILCIESYEDSLHNIATERVLESVAEREEAHKSLLGDETYRMRYLLNLPLEAAETTLDELQLQRPFSYTLEILTEDGPVHKPVDVIETFNHLYGLRVRRMEAWTNEQDERLYRVVKATDSEGKRHILVVWRDMDDLNVIVERKYLEERVHAMEAAGDIWDEMLINGDTPTPGFASLDPLFKRLMMAGEGGV